MIPLGDHVDGQCPRLLPSAPWVTPRGLQIWRSEPLAKITLLYTGLFHTLHSKCLQGPGWRIDCESHGGRGFNTRLPPRNQEGVSGNQKPGQKHLESTGGRVQASGCQRPGLECPSCSNAWLSWAPHSWAELEALATHSWFQLHFPCLVPISAAAFQALMAELWLETRTARGSQLPNRL